MRIRKQKKFTHRIGTLVVLTSMMFLAEGARCDQVEIIVANHYKKLMKEQETVYVKQKNTLEQEKNTLEQELNQQKEERRLAELNLKSVIGVAGDTPIGEEVKKLVENLNDVPGPNLVGKVEALKETLAFTQEEKVALEQEHRKAQEEKVALEQKHRETKGIIKEIKKTTGGNGTGTPILTRLDEWRGSIDTVKVLEQKLVAVPGDELLKKVEVLMAAKEKLEKMEQAILAKEGTIIDLKESLEEMEETIIEKEETIIDLKESLEEMEETIIEKEETINDLHVELLIAQTEIKSLDEQASLGQVALSEKTTQLNQVLENTYQPFSLLRNESPLTRTPERRTYMETPERPQ